MAERTNLIPQHNPTKYILGSILLTILTVSGVLWLGKDKSEEIVKKEVEKEIAVEQKEEVAAEITVIETPTVAALPTIEENIIKTFQSDNDFFKVEYEGKRKLYQDNENGGQRYTFYDKSGNITVHVGNNWSWTYPERIYSEALQVDGQDTFVYETSNQKIVDFEKNNKKYTIQCVHNKVEAIKEECQKFMDNFKFI